MRQKVMQSSRRSHRGRGERSCRFDYPNADFRYEVVARVFGKEAGKSGKVELAASAQSENLQMVLTGEK